jgi:hypothetical protein
MIKAIVSKKDLNNYSEIQENRVYWLKQTPESRVHTVDYIRKKQHGSSERLQRSVRIIQRSSR